MSNPRCDECGIGCCIEDMVIVYESPDDSPIRTEHNFCSMSCMENYFFPDHRTTVTERDAALARLDAELKEKDREIAEKEAKIAGLMADFASLHKATIQ
jgi:hypothetical protein